MLNNDHEAGIVIFYCTSNLQCLCNEVSNVLRFNYLNKFLCLHVQLNLFKKATFKIDFSGWCGKVAPL